MKKQKSQLKGVIILMLTSIIWGSSFVAQSVGMESIDAFTFSGVRTLMGAAFLLPFLLIRNAVTGRNMTDQQRKARRETAVRTLKAGAVLGVIFFVAGNLQQFAFYWSTPGKIAFVTSLYMFFVPLMGLFIGKRLPAASWVAVALAFVGLYFLCIDPAGFTGINKGDALAFLCAIAYGVHILWVERVSDETDGLLLAASQFTTAGLMSCVMMFIFEHPTIETIRIALPSLLYSGIMSCGLGYTLQIVGQKYTEATIAGLAMCCESVFAVITSAIVLHDIMSPRETAGCVIMFVAILLSQLAESGFIGKMQK